MQITDSVLVALLALGAVVVCALLWSAIEVGWESYQDKKEIDNEQGLLSGV